jgi:hypothetical protein
VPALWVQNGDELISGRKKDWHVRQSKTVWFFSNFASTSTSAKNNISINRYSAIAASTENVFRREH